jgi:plastocyanin
MLERHPLSAIFVFLLLITGCFVLLSPKNGLESKKIATSIKGISTQKIPPKATSTPAPTLTPTPTTVTNVTTITYTDTGFSPQTVSIKKGDKVVFKNTASLDMWVASNYFPTSRLYPGTDNAQCDISPTPVMFDACTGVLTGESWSFTFDKVGKWSFHNHLKPSHGGTITVTAE